MDHWAEHLALAANGATAAAGEAARGGWTWLADPRSAVLLALGAVIVLGGGRRLWLGWKARRAAGRLAEPDASPEEVEAAAEHGRAALMELFEILGTPGRPAPVREAAGRALAALWKADDLIAEEEQALVRRGFAVDWRARRRYPRGLHAPIPLAVDYGVPFLRDGGRGVGPSDLLWSHRILGAERAGLERWTDWKAGAGRAEFAINPGDFAGTGPHRLVLHARVRTGPGLSGPWEIELPQMPFPVEFDPRLDVEALFALPDDARAEILARALTLEPPEPAPDPDGSKKPLPIEFDPRLDVDARSALSDDARAEILALAGAPEPSAPAPDPAGSTYLDLNDEMALRDPPEVVVRAPLPCDLAHRVELEFEGVPGRYAAGAVVVAGDAAGDSGPIRVALAPPGPLPAGAIDRPGERAVRAVLTADPDLAWADPAVRSAWPGTLATPWVAARVVRR